MLMQIGGRPHGSPLLMAIETNGGRTGKFIDEAWPLETVQSIHLSMKLRPLETVQSIHIYYHQKSV
jgi:hypothetical protein